MAQAIQVSLTYAYQHLLQLVLFTVSDKKRHMLTSYFAIKGLRLTGRDLV